ncbi:hypothetical protein [Brachyspira sp. G79]|uniref:hypothetical protein n=1 Tax=Brachyspira sp. G79 TaxID=1358104 RepID=UPI000BBC04A2|nr:hypothetical protein [Brachyspira sp. G79]PCG20493.1 hypothetical protein KQ44_11135 [Brachyspira sp. G79]
MKTKIFLILIMIIFAVSCTKNNPANPVNVSENNSRNTETKETSSSDNQKNSDNNTGTSSENDNSAENTDTISHENHYNDKANVYKGIAKHTIRTGGITTQPEDVEIYADIYEDENIVELYIPRRVLFENAKEENGKYNLTKTEDGKTYILSMTVSGDSISNFDLTIQGQGETVYIKSDKLNKTE